ncbi:hypothetical protein GE107_21555 [Cohnella sp. CFH 77786]|uniref:leucine-rich repeat domain-containing protein n=1 Tax=Cohnella sp. CFH 77786 TaxID=2662265 RepID=UPI001C60CC4D|nr:leucine-rich repeat domain-containing protein [Cohnella sp. CFH 77786]MBW5448637.1 hypothetical protein [Cohnella sp. CFH 77786]
MRVRYVILLFSIFMVLQLTVGKSITFQPRTVYADAVDIEAKFPDPNLNKVIHDWLGVSVTDTVYQSDIVVKTSDPGGDYLNLSNKNISSLEGMDIFEGSSLKRLYLSNNNISDISSLSGITSLQVMDIGNNQITRIAAINGMTNLVWLNLGFNQITDISPIAGLLNLKSLFIGNNQINNISPVAGLTNLTFLSSEFNQITDISPVAGLTNLTSLVMEWNQITDVSPVSGLTNLTNLLLSKNQISDINPLVNLSKLETLTLSNNNLSNATPLQTLIDLKWLDLSRNNIVDLSALVGLTETTYLDLSNNPIPEISPIAGMTKLNQLFLSNTLIKDLNALQNMTVLQNLQASQALISNVSGLSGLTQMTSLNLQYNPIIDVTPLSGLTNLLDLIIDSTFVNLFNGTNKAIIDGIPASKIITPQIRYGFVDGNEFGASFSLNVGEMRSPGYGFLSTNDGTTWSNTVSWHQGFLDEYFKTPSTFVSADPSIATVNPTTGQITGVSQGTTQITTRLFGWASDYTEHTFDVVVDPSEPPPVAVEPSEPPPDAVEPSEPPPVAVEPSEPPPVAVEPSEPPLVAVEPSEPPPVAVVEPSESPPVAVIEPSEPPPVAVEPSEPPPVAVEPSEPPPVAVEIPIPTAVEQPNEPPLTEDIHEVDTKQPLILPKEIPSKPDQKIIWPIPVVALILLFVLLYRRRTNVMVYKGGKLVKKLYAKPDQVIKVDLRDILPDTPSDDYAVVFLKNLIRRLPIGSSFLIYFGELKLPVTVKNKKSITVMIGPSSEKNPTNEGESESLHEHVKGVSITILRGEEQV